MILASDFSGIGIAILWTLFTVIVVCLVAGAITAGLIAKFAKRPRLWMLTPVCAVGWAAILGLVWFAYMQWMATPTSADRPIAEEIEGTGGRVGLNERREVSSVKTGGPQMTDANLPTLVGLRSLKQLDLTGSAVTDEGLRHLKDLRGLQSLNLQKTQITNAGLEHLKALTGLTVLNLSATQVTDDGLENLYELESLGNLWVRDTMITDAGRLRLMAKLHKLRMVDDISCSRSSAGVQLDISSRQMDAAAFEEIGQWRELTSLYLTQTPTSDDDLAALKELPLRGLGLGGTKVSDAGLVHLESMTKLEYLVLQDTAVTAAGLASLQQTLSRCSIVR